jgi:hypothetical protein
MVDLRRIDAQIRGTRARLAAAVTALGTALTVYRFKTHRMVLELGFHGLGHAAW